jgi:hypothetical protein
MLRTRWVPRKRPSVSRRYRPKVRPSTTAATTTHAPLLTQVQPERRTGHSVGVRAFGAMAISDAVRRAVLVALVVYSAALAVALLAPTSGTQSTMASWVSDLGVRVGFSPETASQARAEFLNNAAILAPVSALGSLLWPQTTWRDWTAYAFVIAVLVELSQAMVLPGRTPSPVDVVANTLGGLTGAVLVLGWRLLTTRRPSAAGERWQELDRRPRLDQD